MIHKRPCYWDLKDILSTSEKIRSVLQTDFENLGHLSELAKVEYPEDIQWERFRKVAALEGRRFSNEGDGDLNGTQSTSNNVSESDIHVEESSPEVPSTVTNEEREKDKLPTGTRVELPFWIAETLAVRSFVVLQAPHAYSSRTRKDILADATFVNFKSKAPFYYRYGTLLANCLGDQDLKECLLYALAYRYKKVLQISNSIMTIQNQQRTRIEARQLGLTSIPNSLSEVVQKLDETEKQILNIAVESSMRLQEWRTGRLGTQGLESNSAVKRIREFENNDMRLAEKHSKVQLKGPPLTELSLNHQNIRFSNVTS